MDEKTQTPEENHFTSSSHDDTSVVESPEADAHFPADDRASDDHMDVPVSDSGQRRPVSAADSSAADAVDTRTGILAPPPPEKRKRGRPSTRRKKEPQPVSAVLGAAVEEVFEEEDAADSSPASDSAESVTPPPRSPGRGRKKKAQQWTGEGYENQARVVLTMYNHLSSSIFHMVSGKPREAFMMSDKEIDAGISPMAATLEKYMSESAMDPLTVLLLYLGGHITSNLLIAFGDRIPGLQSVVSR